MTAQAAIAGSVPFRQRCSSRASKPRRIQCAGLAIETRKIGRAWASSTKACAWSKRVSGSVVAGCTVSTGERLRHFDGRFITAPLQRVLIGLAQALEADRVFIRAMPFEQHRVLALDTASIGVWMGSPSTSAATHRFHSLSVKIPAQNTRDEYLGAYSFAARLPKMAALHATQGTAAPMLEKDTISIHLVREALLQSCATGAATIEVLRKVGIDPGLLELPTARISATAYARLWRLLARRMDDEFFGMDPRKLKSGSLAFLCHACVAQPTLATSLETGLGFLSLMLERMPAQLVRQQSLAEIVLHEPEPKPQRAFTYFTYWMIVHGVACWLAGRRIPILAIELRCPQPDFYDDYQVMFSDNLRFDRPRTRMIFSADCLDLPIKRSPEELKRFLAHAPANILVKYRDPDSLATRIKHDLRQMPPDTWPETEGLAATLCISASNPAPPSGGRRANLPRPQGQRAQRTRDSVAGGTADQLRRDCRAVGVWGHELVYRAFRKWAGSDPGHYRSLILNEVTRV